MEYSEFADKQTKCISYEYIRGLIDGEGCFTFSQSTDPKNGKKTRLPAFALSMSTVDRDLIMLVKDTLKLRNKVYSYKARIGGPVKHNTGMTTLIIRDFGQIKNIIVPLFYKKLIGNKGIQFERWIEKMASDPLVPKNFKLIPILYKNGYYETNWRKYG